MRPFLRRVVFSAFIDKIHSDSNFMIFHYYETKNHLALFRIYVDVCFVCDVYRL